MIAEPEQAPPLPLPRALDCAPVPLAAAPSAARSDLALRLADFAELAKVRISGLVLVTTGIGYALADAGPFRAGHFAAAIAGTALAAVGANSLNQLLERDLDRLMRRTRERPLPAGRVQPATVLAFGLAAAVLGTALLAAFTNGLTAALAAATVFSYVAIYTPAKRRTWAATLIGAVPGALPPVMGVTAASGRVDAVALWLFLVLFLWQLPHFYAIAWLYREDYARGGFPMLPVVDTAGRRTAFQSLCFGSLLLAVTCLPPAALDARGWYVPVAAALGLGFFASLIRFARARDDASARGAFLVSVVYLPLLLVAAAAA